MALKRKIKLRDINVDAFHNIFLTSVKDLCDNYDDDNLPKLTSIVKVAKQKLEKILSLNEEIEALTENEASLAKHIEETLNFEIESDTKITQVEEFIKLKTKTESVTTSATQNTIKLPKLQLKKFYGDPAEWKSFYDSFICAVDNQDSLTDVEKMNYLLNLIKGPAEDCIKGLKLSNENYKPAMDLLKERFGDDQVLIWNYSKKLVDMENVKGIKDTPGLRRLYDHIEVQVRCLKNVGQDPKNFGPILLPAIMPKLPDEIKLEISRKFGREVWDITEVLTILKKELEAREKVLMTSSDKHSIYNDDKYSATGLLGSFQRKDSKSNDNDKGRSSSGSNLNRISCLFCKGNHKSQNCTAVSKIDARLDILKQERRCFSCLKRGHLSKNCFSKIKCFECSGSHHVSVCKGKPQGQDEAGGTTNMVAESLGNKIVHLQTAIADVYSNNEKDAKKFRILLDAGSQLSYCSPEVQKTLNLNLSKDQNMSINSFGEVRTEKKLKSVNFFVKTKDAKVNIPVNAFVSEICHPINSQPIEITKSKYKHLEKLEFADNNEKNEPLKIDILIGADYYWQFVTNTVVRGEMGGPVAILTKLGYILSGPSIQTTESSVNISHVLKISNEFKSEVAELNDSVKKFWNLDSVGIYNDDEISAMDKFETDVKFLKEEKRYEVKFPFKEACFPIEDNYTLCEKRLSSLTKREFKNNPSLLNSYDNIIKEQCDSEIIEKCPTSYEIGATCYIPHRPVVRNDKTTTKMRMVFDASAKNKGAKSLNECLLPGPSLTTSLFNVLLRFRAYNIAIVGDIEKAFHQISLEPSQRDYFRFLWYKDPDILDFENLHNNEYQEYRFRRVPMGARPSPFLLSATLRKHIEFYKDIDPELVQKLLNGLHCDDFDSGANDISEAKNLFSKSKELLADANFNLRKFQSNSSELENLIGDEFKAENDLKPPTQNKVLGIMWNKQKDTLLFEFTDLLKHVCDPPTKRNILKIIASVYDPLGVINPLVVKMKILFQDICINKVEWDEKLTGDVTKQWELIVKGLQALSVIEISRKYCFFDVCDPFKSVQLHGFSDSSKRAYGAAVYLRFQRVSGFTKVILVSAKSRVNPIGEKSMPRLELLGNLLLAKLIKSVYNGLKSVYEICVNILWTDSAVSYSWIKNTDKVYKTFVENRVKDIRELISPDNWRLVPSEENPADIISRGLSLSDPKVCSLWFNGPEFLILDESEWPALKVGDSFRSNDDVTRLTSDSKEDLVKFSELSVTRLTSDNKSEEVMCLTNDFQSNDYVTRLTSDGTEDLFKVSEVSVMRLTSDTADEHEIAFKDDDVTRLTSDNKVEETVTCLTSDFQSNDKNFQSSPFILGVTCNEKFNLNKVIDIERYSNISKLLSITVWVLRFINNTKKKIKIKKKIKEEKQKIKLIINKRPLAEELCVAKLLWIFEAQQSIKHDVKYLQKLHKQLNIFNDNGLLRCRGRLSNAPDCYNRKFPYLLSKEHYLTTLFIRHSHFRVFHNGVGETLNELRNQFWVPKARSFVRKLIHECRICRRYEGKSYMYPETPQLPSSRLDMNYAFRNIGLDYAGPVYVKNIFVENVYDSNSKNLYKAWIAIISCTTSRAIHLDLATDYSGPACVNILRRFTSRYGAPKLIISDNGSSFVNHDVEKFVSAKGITWKFNIQAAPWTGGFFERMVRSVKRCLRKILGKAKVSYEEMLTILKEIECIINNRPLTYQYEELSEEALTPNHLVLGRKLLPENFEDSSMETNTNNRISVNKRASYVNTLLEHFWKRWQREYLADLREHQRLNCVKSNSDIIPKIDDFVLIQEDKLPRSNWRVGKIKTIINSRDGCIRGAEVEVMTNNRKTYLCRPVNKLFPIEQYNYESDTEIEKIDVIFVDDKNIPKITGGSVE